MVSLDAFVDADIDRLISWIPSPRVLSQWAASGFSHPLTRAQMEVRMKEMAERGGRIFKVLDHDQSVVGHVELGGIDHLHGSLRIGRVFVAPHRRGQGIGTELMQAALVVAFDQLQMHRVELSVFDFNQAAIACYERVGFRREGVRRDVLRFADEYWSEIVMSMLAPEWGADRKAG
jgi:RimJ/RimL family protein N-acetyltransferase